MNYALLLVWQLQHYYNFMHLHHWDLESLPDLKGILETDIEAIFHKRMACFKTRTEILNIIRLLYRMYCATVDYDDKEEEGEDEDEDGHSVDEQTGAEVENPKKEEKV